jgi:ribonuclease Z
MMGNQVEKGMAFDLPKSLPDGLHVLVCGAGGPLPDKRRSSACLAVIAGDSVFLVDVGAGAARNLQLAGLPPNRIERVFLTHFHSDHIDGIGELATLRWAGSHWEAPLPLHGPRGAPAARCRSHCSAASRAWAAMTWLLFSDGPGRR